MITANDDALAASLALSGLLESQSDEVAAAYRNGMDVHVGASSDGWARLDAVRRAV